MKSKPRAATKYFRGSGLDPRRHPLSKHLAAVAGLCAELARRNGVEPVRAARAGLLHDWAKPLDATALKRLMRVYGVKPDRGARRIPQVWHGPVSAAVARAGFGLKDPESIEAISGHSTIGPNSPLLARILFVADFCASDRRYREAAVGRRLALRSLDLGVRYALASKLAYLYNEGCMIHPGAIALWKSFFRRVRG